MKYTSVLVAASLLAAGNANAHIRSKCQARFGCTVETIDFHFSDDYSQDATILVKLPTVESQLPIKVPVPSLFPPAFLQRYSTIKVYNSGQLLRIRQDIPRINKCIQSQVQCFVDFGYRGLKPGDEVQFSYEYENVSAEGLAKSAIFRFQEGLDSTVILKGFNGKFRYAGASKTTLNGNVVFTSKGRGWLLISELGSWSEFAREWKNTPLPAETNEIAQQILSSSKDQESSVRAARKWIAENVRYEYKPQTVAEMRHPESARATLASRKGDCKALTVLLQSILASLGIDSLPAYTRIDDGKARDLMSLDVPLPGYFNHVILYVPSLGKYFDATLEIDQLDVDIRQYVEYALQVPSGRMDCFSKPSCEWIGRSIPSNI